MSTNSSATAPLVGRHRKSNSLIGFDPLLKEDVSPTTTDRGATPPVESEDREGRSSISNVSADLRMIASQLELSSPRRISDTAPDAAMSPTSLLKGRKSVTTPKLPWQKHKPGHRKTKSLASIPALWSRNSGALTKNTKTPATALSANSSPVTHIRSVAAVSPNQTHAVQGPSSGMINDLMELQMTADSFHALSLPGLAAKPRPTSFLTGQEVVRVSEIDATAWQLEMPIRAEFETTAKICQFLESYEKDECLMDLNLLVNLTALDLRQFAAGNFSPAAAALAACHRPLVESLLECGTDLTVHGFLSIVSTDRQSRRQVLILECQRQFLCAFCGTPGEQQGKYNRQSESVQMAGVSVFSDRLEAVQSVETSMFGILDRLTEENPFYDVVFAGHSYGAAIATLAAFRYASARAELRIAALVTASPKVGAADFRLAVHSLPNLKVMRVEYGLGRPSSGCAVGHTIRIHPSVPTNKVLPHPVKAYKFSDATDVGRSLFKRDKDVADYVRALESLHTWVQDYYLQDGLGVKGKDNEARQMV